MTGLSFFLLFVSYLSPIGNLPSCLPAPRLSFFAFLHPGAFFCPLLKCVRGGLSDVCLAGPKSFGPPWRGKHMMFFLSSPFFLSERHQGKDETSFPCNDQCWGVLYAMAVGILKISG